MFITLFQKNDSKMIALALVNALLLLVVGVNGKLERSELTDKKADLAIRC